MAEAYWDMEWTLQQEGFDYAYDKRLYDRLREQRARPVREHLCADMNYQDKLARFLENHDEPRAASAFAPEVHPAAAVLTFLSPGLRLFHQGQFEGRRVRISPHLVRAPNEAVDSTLAQFYDRLLAVLGRPETRDGNWALLECVPTWGGNTTSDNFIAFRWESPALQWLFVAVNYSPQQSQCFVRLPCPRMAGRTLSRRVWRSGCSPSFAHLRRARRSPRPKAGALRTAWIDAVGMDENLSQPSLTDS
jgi:hypothetical protein